MQFDIMTLFPEMCESFLSESIIGRAIDKNIISVNCHNIRDYTTDKHNRVDDTPYGGGKGMLMQTQPINDCFEAICNMRGEKPHLIYMSPKGERFTQKKAIELSQYSSVAILCGHYEGVDQRVLDKLVDEEISVGDYVLTGGELPALIVVDAVSRMQPGVLSDDSCFTEESHYNGLLEYPQYTRPPIWEGMEVPAVLMSGHHKNIAKWQREQSLIETVKHRPDMLETAELTDEDRQFISKYSKML